MYLPVLQINVFVNCVNRLPISFIYLSIYLFVCLFIYLFIFLSEYSPWSMITLNLFGFFEMQDSRKTSKIGSSKFGG